MSEIREEELDVGISVDDSDARDRVYAEPVRGAGAVKGLYAKGNRKRLYTLVGAGTLLFVALVYTFTSAENPDEKGNAGVVSSGAMQGRESSGRTLIDGQEVERYNREALEKEKEENPYAHPIVMVDDAEEYDEGEYDSPFDEASNMKTPTRLSQAGSTENGSNRGQVQQQEYYDDDAYKSADDLIARLVAAETVVPAVNKVSWEYAAPRRVSSESGGNVLAESSDDQSGKMCKNILARAGSMAMATTDIALNSDVGGPVSLTIVNGVNRGSQLIGGFERKDKWIRMELNRLVTPDETITVNAIGLDLDTTLNAVSGEVDRHVAYRYGWWGLGTVLSAIGKASAANANSNAFVSDGVITQNTTKDTSRELKMALGSLGEDIGEVMRDRINRPITVSLKVDDQVGIFFVDDVCLDNSN